MAIIGISGKKTSGKDTIGKIIQYLLRDYVYIDYSFEQYFNLQTSKTWQIKKFADKLKDIVCLLINCTREQLEDETFKNTELGEEWRVYNYNNELYSVNDEKLLLKVINNDTNEFEIDLSKYLIKLTPRLLLQLLGTECGREIIHPNIWVNSLFSDYFNDFKDESKNDHWIITDVRFPNEADAIKQRNGIIIRVNRNSKQNLDKIEHISETSLDNAQFDYIISNDGTIEQLIEKVRRILIKEELL